MKKEQSKIKKTVNKMFQYLSAISKNCRRDDVDAAPSPSPPPLDSDQRLDSNPQCVVLIGASWLCVLKRGLLCLVHDVDM